MDVVFVNQLILTKEVFQEFYKDFSALPHRAYQVFKIILRIFGILVVLFALFDMYKGYFLTSITQFIIGSLLLFFYPIYLRYLSRMRYRQQVILSNGRDMEKKIEFGEQIHITSSNKTEVHFDYSQIKEIIESKHLIVLRTAHAVGIIIGKDNFTVGKLEDFRRFIRGKCPSARFVSCK